MQEKLTAREFLKQARELADQFGKIAEGRQTDIVAAALVTMQVGILLNHPVDRRRYGALRFHSWVMDSLSAGDQLPEDTYECIAVRRVIMESLSLTRMHNRVVDVGGSFKADDAFIERVSSVIEDHDDVPNLICHLMACTDELDTSGAN